MRAIRIKNSGAAEACLTGARASIGNFIHFLDADDFLRPGALKVIAAQCSPDVSKVQFPLAPVNAQGQLLGDPFPALKEAYTSAELIELINTTGTYSTPPTSGNVYRRDVIERVGQIEYEKWIDGIIYLLAPFVGRVVTLHEPLVAYRVHARNFSAFDKMSAGRFDEEGRRFVERLKHLSALCQKFGLKGWSMPDTARLGFVLERRLLARVASGGRPSASDVASFVRAAWREGRSFKSSALMSAWATALLVAPRSQLPKIVALRADPWSRGPVSKLLKRLAAGRPAASAHQ